MIGFIPPKSLTNPNYTYYSHNLASGSDYTVVSFKLGSNQLTDGSAGGEVDFQVEALLGTEYRIPGDMTPWGQGFYYEFIGEKSGWSNTQTISIPDVNPTTPITTPTPTSTSPSTYDNQPETNDYTPPSIPLTTFLLVTTAS